MNCVLLSHNHSKIDPITSLLGRRSSGTAVVSPPCPQQFPNSPACRVHHSTGSRSTSRFAAEALRLACCSLLRADAARSRNDATILSSREACRHKRYTEIKHGDLSDAWSHHNRLHRFQSPPLVPHPWMHQDPSMHASIIHLCMQA